MSSWTDPLWLAEAHEWIEQQVAGLGDDVVGAIEQNHVYRWSTVMRVPTGSGDVYFKANDDASLWEAALVALLARRRPDCVAPLLAVDVERGWMLMADAGERLRELVERERDLTRWLEVLPLYAGLQIDLSSDVDEMHALGVPDLRLSTLPARYEEMLDGLSDPPSRLVGSEALIRELCEEMAGYGLPETIQHDDFHDGQVFVRDNRYRLLDWGDACVSQPFFTLAVTLEGVLSWGLDDIQGSVDVRPFRDAYLVPFEQIAGATVDLRAAAESAMRLGWICRAVNGHFSGSEAAETQVRLRMFLDGRP